MALDAQTAEPPIDRVVSYEEACFRLSKSIRTLYRDVREGRIKAVKLSARKVGIRESEIRRYIDELPAC